MPRMKNEEEKLENEVFQENVQPDTDAERSLKLERALQDALGEIAELKRRADRVEYAGNSKNKQREYDVLNTDLDNIKYATLPSLDGKNPVINWYALSGGASYLDESSGVLVDTQAWNVEFLDGTKKRFTLGELSPQFSGNRIPVRCNNWKEYLRNLHELYERKHKYQIMVTRTRNSKVNAAEIWNKILDDERNLMVNVTLSEDNGYSYSGKTFDILAKMLNGLA